MAWELEIHHIGLRKAGDSTLLIAKNGSADFKSVLADGGLRSDSLDYVMPYVRSKLAGRKLDGIISTHYDKDHIEGLTEIIKDGTLIDMNTVILDRGINRIVRSKGAKAKAGTKRRKTQADYSYSYLSKSRFARSRIPARKYNEWVPRIDNNDPSYSSDLLKRPSAAVSAVSKGYSIDQIMKADPIKFANPTPFGQSGFDIPASWAIDNSDNQISLGPTVRIKIIAANGYVLGNNGEPFLVRQESQAGEVDADLENQGSLGFVIEFGRFRYFCGGDLEQTQEDELVGSDGYLYHKRVHAMKLSHHGANTASSDTFLGGLRPMVVVISNGINNQHRHPSITVLNRLKSNWGSVTNTLNAFYLTGGYYAVKPSRETAPYVHRFRSLTKVQAKLADFPKAVVAMGDTADSELNDDSYYADTLLPGTVVVKVNESDVASDPISFEVSCKWLTAGDRSTTYTAT